MFTDSRLYINAQQFGYSLVFVGSDLQTARYNYKYLNRLNQLSILQVTSLYLIYLLVDCHIF